MAIALKFNISLTSDAKTLSIIDKTGQYSSLNTGGWGAPNYLVGTALTSTLKIAKRNSDGLYGTETTVSLFPTLPSDIGGSSDVTAVSAGQGSTYADAIYRLIYTVTGVSAGTPYSYSTTRYDVLRNSIACCYQKMEVKVSECTCNCKSIEEKFRKFSVFYRLLKGAECCGDLNAIQKYLDELTKICNHTGCGC